MSLLSRFFRTNRHRYKCPGCGATTLQRCERACPNRLNRNINAPECHDSLHHHCALMPFCTEGCKNDQRNAPPADIAGSAELTQAEVDALMHPDLPPDGLGGTNGVQHTTTAHGGAGGSIAATVTATVTATGGAGGAGVAIDLYEVAKCLAAYALNVSYGGRLEPFELEHVTKLAAQVGCKVAPRQIQTASMRAIFDEISKERLLQISIGYDAAYDDAHPLHGRMEALERLNDPNHTDKDIVEAAAILVADLERRKRHPQPPAEAVCSACGRHAGHAGTQDCAEPTCPMQHKETHNGHVLYEQGDQNIPPSLLDQNGDIVLAQCKVCGAAEIELEVACTGEKLVRHE